MTITYNRSDLDYLFEQVSINYRYTDSNGDVHNFVVETGAPEHADQEITFNYAHLNNPLDPRGVREVSGANNNLVGSNVGNYDPFDDAFTPGVYTTFGEESNNFLRTFQPTYSGQADGYGQSVDYDPAGEGGGTAGGSGFVGTGTVGTSLTDGTPRLISNLIASSVIDPSNPAYNPAAAAAMTDEGGHEVDVTLGNGTTITNGGAEIPNAGVLEGIKYNEWFVAFGQFFDHGLDFIQKGGSGTVMIPIPEGDPLYDPTPGALNFMPLTRGSLANSWEDYQNSAADFVNADSNWQSGTAGIGDLNPGVVPIFAATATPMLQAGVTPEYTNETGLSIDQSQTYGSDPSVNALVRQYDADGNATGKLLTGAADGLAQNGTTAADLSDAPDSDARNLGTWADLKANAEKIGIQLTDLDVNDAPMLKVDPTGKLLYDPQSTTLYNTTDLPAAYGADYDVNEDPFVRDPATGEILRTGHAFISDMDPNANPYAPILDSMTHQPTGAIRTADADGIITGAPFDPTGTTYDDELLNAHFVSGDHRVNENFGLTAMHKVFHEEHNIQADAIMNGVIAEAAAIIDAAVGGTAAEQADAEAEAVAFVNRWLVDTGTTSGATNDNTFDYTDASGATQVLTLDGLNVRFDGTNSALAWNGDAVFQAARVVTESEYNHIAIDQYVGTLYPALPEFVSYSADIDMGISMEFSQAVFRLGHSMLTETIHVQDPTTNSVTEVDLFDGFLNPVDYTTHGAQAITLGLMNQYGNEVDEFVTPALQQALVGLPLDLAALNIARGRDVGLPTLNELRDQVFQGLAEDISNTTNGSALAPYTSWGEYGAHLRHEGTLTNMIAAYGRDDVVDAGAAVDWGLAEARADVLAGNVADPGAGATVDDNLAYLRERAQRIVDAAKGDYATNGILDPDTGAAYTAAQHAAATTFLWGGYQATDNPDIPGIDMLGDIVLTSGDLGFWDVDLWIGGLAERPLFDGPLGTTFSFIMLDFGQRMQDGDRFYYLYRMPPGHHLGDQIIGEQFNEMIQRTNDLEHLHGDAFGTPDGVFILDDTQSDYFNAFDTANQVTLSDGTQVVAADSHFLVAGLSGNDRLILGNGDDTGYGDDGNDYIQGGQGNDKIYGGKGDDFIIDDENDDFIHGGEGNDTIFAGPGALDTAHGGKGNDEVHGGDGVDEIFGEEGDDALFGEGDTDLMIGGDGNDFMDGGDSVDEMFGGNGNDWFRGGVGDDHMNGGAGNDLMEGGLGPAANDGDRYFGDTPPALNVQEVFNGTVGTNTNDLTPFQTNMDIASYEDVDIAITASLQTSNNNGTGSNLIDQYAFVEGLVGSRFNDDLTGASQGAPSNNGWNNYLVGGAGIDRLRGLGGDDLLVGDDLVVDSNLMMTSATYTMVYQDFSEEWRPQFADGSLGHFLGDNFDPVAAGGAAAAHARDVLIGDGGNDTMIGGAGNDWMVGGAGADHPVSGDGRDTANYRGGSVGVNVNLETNTATGGHAQGDTFKDVEIVRGTNQADMLTGDGAANSLIGNGGDDTLSGGDGNDLLKGGAGADDLDGGLGRDTADYRGSAAGVTVDLNSGTGVGGDAEGDTLTSIEVLRGSSQGDELIGDNAGNSLIGNGGNDTLSGDGGNDWLSGGAGADDLNGGAGFDRLAGGSGADNFIFDSVADVGGDLIRDFEVGDTIDLSSIDAIAGTMVNDSFTLLAEGAVFNGTSGQLRFEYNMGNDETVVQGDNDGNGAADFEIVLTGQHSLTSGDFNGVM